MGLLKRLVFWLGAVWCLLAPAGVLADGAEQPKTMTKMTVAVESPQLPKGSFGTKPKTFYMAGTRYSRIEEMDDPVMKLHELIITSEPDTWMINLTAKAGQHMTDPGPTFVVHSPVFPFMNIPKIYYSLELGKEFDFFQKISRKEKHEKIIGGRKLDSYAVGTEGYMLVVYTNPGKEVPLFTVLFHGDNLIYVVKYLDYEQELPFDGSLFKVPAGITITEAETGQK